MKKLKRQKSELERAIDRLARSLQIANADMAEVKRLTTRKEPSGIDLGTIPPLRKTA